MDIQLIEVGKRVRKARKDRRLSQAELAELIQISPSHMSDFENGKTNISLDIFMRLTEALQVSADWLLQTNIPQVSSMQTSEFAELLSDCSSSETQSIIKMVKDMEVALKQSKDS